MSDIVKALAGVMLAATLGTGAAFAETNQCRQINSKKDREACYTQQAAAKQARSESSNPKMHDAIEQMKIDDDRLAKRLQGICRGC